VDDAPFIREVLRHIFSGTDIQIIGEAQDGEEAVLITKRLKPEVVLMDIVMPKKSGIEAALEILKELPETRIVACSTLDQNSMVLRALDAGCCNYVAKPFKADELIKAVRSAARMNSKEAGV
jgi:two-component system chemotaxis response regulator CheY